MQAELLNSRQRMDDIASTKEAEKRMAQQAARREVRTVCCCWFEVRLSSCLKSSSSLPSQMDLLVRAEYEERLAAVTTAFRKEIDALKQKLEDALRAKEQQASFWCQLLL